MFLTVFLDLCACRIRCPCLHYLYNWGRCIQTPPGQRSTDSKPVCHFDPLLMEIDVSYMAFGLVVNWLLKQRDKVLGYIALVSY